MKKFYFLLDQSLIQLEDFLVVVFAGNFQWQVKNKLVWKLIMYIP